jgi:hypothetical protein
MEEFGGWVRGCRNGDLASQNISKTIARRSTVACLVRLVFPQSAFSVVDLSIPLEFLSGLRYRDCSSQSMDQRTSSATLDHKLLLETQLRSFVRPDGRCLLVHELCSLLSMAQLGLEYRCVWPQLPGGFLCF